MLRRLGDVADGDEHKKHERDQPEQTEHYCDGGHVSSVGRRNTQSLMTVAEL